MEAMLAHGFLGKRASRAAAVGWLALVLTVTTAGGACAVSRPGATPARALTVVTVQGGLDQPTAFTFGPDGRIWYVEKSTGQIRVLDPATDADHLFTRLTNVDGTGERGMLGIALHPDWPAKPFVYVYVTRTDDGVLVNELVRIRREGGKPAGRRVLFRWAVSGATNHNGGRILFGPDGLLYVVTGENANPANSQQKGNLRGKILRIRPDGSVPATNPFGTRVWSFGHRNSFGMAFDPFTDRLWETENGPECNDEINRIRRGGNFAWGPNESCGSLPAPRDTNRDGPSPRLLPATFIRDTIGITGAAFCRACGLGAGFAEDLFFGEVNGDSLWRAQLNEARTDIVKRAVILHLGSVVFSMEVGPKGRIYFSGPNGIYRIAAT
jgi:glucose/arabinose dehydrogenase